MSNLIVAIDGPAASGKSTVARTVAGKLNCAYVDSGSLYRGLTWFILCENPDEPNSARVIKAMNSINLELFLEAGAVRFKINGIDPGAELRSTPVQQMVSVIAAMPEVRKWALRLLRGMTRFGDLAIEGRDIGTVVFPKTPFKFYLDADEEVRARRRHGEMMESSESQELENVQKLLAKRDALDSKRTLAPLRKAPGARVLDTTEMTIDEVVAVILNEVGARDPEKTPLLYRLSRRIFLIWLKIWLRYEVHGKENIPLNGGCIIAANHASFLDPIVVGCGIMHRYVRFIARETLFKRKIADWWAKGMGVVRIDRTKGDIAALKTALQVLRRGGLICVFPEGTRTEDGNLQKARSGIGFLIAKAEVPVVPVRIFGTFDALPKNAKLVKSGKISVVFNQPIMPSTLKQFGTGKNAYKEMSEFLMSRIASIN